MKLFQNLITNDLYLTTGIKLVSPGGGSGTWQNINANADHINFSDEIERKKYFDSHPIWSNIREEIIDNQYMIRIPKFYFKNDNHQQIWISPYKINDTFKCHPAFMKNGQEQECFWIGKYQGNISNSKCQSIPNVNPMLNTTNANDYKYCTNRNVNGVVGFQLTNIYMWSVIQFLFLIEYSTTDSASKLGKGGSTESVSSNAKLEANYRGITGLNGALEERLAGARISSSKFQIYDNLGNQTWVSTNEPIVSGITSVDTAKYSISMKTNNYNNVDFKDIFIANTVGSKTNGTYSDIAIHANSTMVCCGYGLLNYHGIFSMIISGSETSSHRYRTIRLSKI